MWSRSVQQGSQYVLASHYRTAPGTSVTPEAGRSQIACSGYPESHQCQRLQVIGETPGRTRKASLARGDVRCKCGVTTFTHMKGGYVYIMTNTHNTTLYTGVTSNLMKRVLQHKKGVFPESFTDQYLCHKLVWSKFVPTIEGAIAEEKRIKHWRRAWKEELIAKENPEWKDLSDGCYDIRDFE